MKSSSLVTSILFGGGVIALVIWVAFIWLPEREAGQQEHPAAIPMKPLEEQVRENPAYTCSQIHGFTECTSGEVTLTFEGENTKLYISFGGYDTTVDCSVYLSIHNSIHTTIEEVKGRTRQEHLLASCASL